MRNIIVPQVFKLLALLPLSVARALGVVIGTGMYFVKGRAHRVTQKNIRACFPDLSAQETRTLVRESLIETAKTATEASIVWRNSWEWLESKIVAVEGEDLMRAELAKGRGLIVLAPHLGNWEVVAPYLASIAPLTAMYQPMSIPAMDKLILSGRSKCNIDMAPTSRKGVLMLLKALQQGKIVGILPDQLPKKEAGAEFAPFFGQETLTMSLVHSLISRTQCPVVSVFAMRVPDGFKIIVLPADEMIYSEDVVASITGLNSSVERCVRLAPTQYQWEYNRFRFPKNYAAIREQKRNAAACKSNCNTQ
ncbi:MAG: lipid A biosynthesis lauroyl acyltransferase [Gammaproteobacteria bacterium]|nr:MAG: lipid A biosynthesis lauroyl acyltransferase [Gammaproteobacteria bacterium]